LPGSSSSSSLGSASQQVAELESLNQIRVPDHAAVLDTNIGVGLVDLDDLLNTLVERLLGTEDGDISLHGLLHGKADVRGGLGAIGLADLVEMGNGLGTNVGGDLGDRGARSKLVADGVGN